jgi:hypothetical protein
LLKENALAFRGRCYYLTAFPVASGDELEWYKDEYTSQDFSGFLRICTLPNGEVYLRAAV